MPHEIDIQPDDHVVFIHIPKTAGDTFNAKIQPFISHLPSCPKIWVENLAKLSLDQIYQYKLFMGHTTYDLMELLFPSGFIFMTFLRDPLIRIVSNFRYLQRFDETGNRLMTDVQKKELSRLKQMSLEEFAVDTTLNYSRMNQNLQTRVLGGTIAKRELSLEKPIGLRLKDLSSSYYSSHPDLLCLEAAKYRLQNGAFLGLTERFQDSLFLLSFVFGWPPILDDLRLNTPPDPNYFKNIEPETLTLLQRKVDLDLELYRFGCELFDQRFNAMTNWLLETYRENETEKLSAPLPQDVMINLLQKNYEARRKQRNQALLNGMGSTYVYIPSEYVEGAFGWHTVEKSEAHGAMVWSGPGLDSGFDLPCPRGTNIQISFYVLMVLKSEIIQKLTLNANNIPITLQYQVDSQGAFVFTGKVPAEAISGPFLQLVFSVPCTTAPRDVTPDNKDSRLLGFLLNWLKLEAQ